MHTIDTSVSVDAASNIDILFIDPIVLNKYTTGLKLRFTKETDTFTIELELCHAILVKFLSSYGDG